MVIDEYLDPQTVRLLCQAYGGRRLTVPTKMAGKCWVSLVETLGEDRARSVVRWFSGEVVAIPMAEDERIKETILALRRQGTPVSEIAQMVFPVRFSERHIHRICAADRAA